MAEPENLNLEHLRETRGDTAKLSTRVSYQTVEMRTSNGHLITVIHHDLPKSGWIAELEARLDRLERRLKLSPDNQSSSCDFAARHNAESPL
jgi:hypothetical protein